MATSLSDLPPKQTCRGCFWHEPFGYQRRTAVTIQYKHDFKAFLMAACLAALWPGWDKQETWETQFLFFCCFLCRKQFMSLIVLGKDISIRVFVLPLENRGLKKPAGIQTKCFLISVSKTKRATGRGAYFFVMIRVTISKDGGRLNSLLSN